MSAVIFAGALLSLAVQSGLGDIQELTPSSDPIHVRVLFEAQPARQAVVAWTTTQAGESHRLHLDTQPRGGKVGSYARTLPSIHSAPYTLKDDEQSMACWSHNVFLSDLEANTTYYVVAESDGKVSREFHFITAPDDGRPVRLLFGGDSRTPRPASTHRENDRRRINARMAALFAEHDDIVAFAHGADYTNRAVWSQLYHWLNDYTEMTTTPQHRLLPIVPARGNHDLDVGFEEMFWWPDRENDYYYTTDLSEQVALITLNTEISRSGNQREWLEAQLKALRPSKRWLIVQFHRPAWPSVRAYSSGEPQRSAWVGLFEQHDIDLACVAHDHALKRTAPIRDDKIDLERGIVYIGDGGLGVPQRKPDASRWYLQSPGKIAVGHHVHMLTFTQNTLHVIAVGIDGETLDEFTLTRDNRALHRVPVPSANDRQLQTVP